MSQGQNIRDFPGIVLLDISWSYVHNVYVCIIIRKLHVIFVIGTSVETKVSPMVQFNRNRDQSFASSKSSAETNIQAIFLPYSILWNPWYFMTV